MYQAIGELLLFHLGDMLHPLPPHMTDNIKSHNGMLLQHLMSIAFMGYATTCYHLHNEY